MKWWRKNEQGVAAVEFALTAPILILLLLGGFETSRYFLIHQKVEKVAYTVADVTAQQTNVTNAQMSQLMDAAGQIMDPYAFGVDGVVIVSSVYKADDASAPVVRWQYVGGGTLARNSSVGTVGRTASLPNGLTLAAKDNVIISEVYYYYRYALSNMVLSDGDIYKTALYRPRLGALITAPN